MAKRKKLAEDEVPKQIYGEDKEVTVRAIGHSGYVILPQSVVGKRIRFTWKVIED